MKCSNFVCHAILVGGLLCLAATARAALIESLPLDGTTNATVGTSGTTPNGAAYTTDHSGNANGAFEFTPGGTTSSTYVSVAGGGGLAGLTTGTIAFWAEWTGTQETACCGGISGVMVGRQDDNVYSNDIIGLNNSNPALGSVRVQLNDAGTNTVSGATPVGNGVWHFITLTFTSGSEDLYIDGHLDGTGTSNVTVNGDTTTPLALGAWLGGGNSFASGAMSDFQVYDTVLTQAQIQALVPEPSSWVALGGLGAMGLFVLARRRRNDAKMRASFGVRTLGICLVCLVALFGCAIVSSAQASVFLGTPQPTDTRTDAYSYAGIGFVADNDATVNELGYWVASADSGGTGVTADAHTVGLFQYIPTGLHAGQYLDIAQATFAAGSTATTPNGYAWLSVTPVTLTPGATYAIEATQGGDTWGPYAGTDSFSSVNPEFGTLPFTGPFSGGSDTMPGVGNYSSVIVNFEGNGGYAGPNIGVVPEPASLVALGGLCGMGLIGLAFRRRRVAASNRAAGASNRPATARAGDSYLSPLAQKSRSSFFEGCFMKSMSLALSVAIVCVASVLRAAPR
jgi:hypothetical protein